MDVLRGLRGSLLGSALIAFAGLAPAQSGQSLTEVQVKAAFVYKFGAFVEWPATAFSSPGAPLAIGVLGADDLAEELERVVAGRKVHDRAVAVRRLQRGESFAGLHVLFVGGSEGPRLAQILERARGQPVLVVTDAPHGPPPPGSMINFVPENDRVRFDVALAPAEEGLLKISARLLAVARKVITS
jgi:hypothetical protein